MTRSAHFVARIPGDAPDYPASRRRRLAALCHCRRNPRGWHCRAAAPGAIARRRAAPRGQPARACPRRRRSVPAGHEARPGSGDRPALRVPDDAVRGYRRFLIRRVDDTDPRRRVGDADAGKPATVASAHHPRAVPGGGGSAADAAGGTGTGAAGHRRRPPRPRPGTSSRHRRARARPPVAGSPRSPASRRCRRRRPTRERRAPTSEPSMLPGRPTRPRSSRRPTGLRRPTRFRRTSLRRTGFRRTSLRRTRLRRTRLPRKALKRMRLRRTGLRRTRARTTTLTRTRLRRTRARRTRRRRMPRRPGATRRTPSRLHRGYPGTTAGQATARRATARKGRRPTRRGMAARGRATTATTVTTTRARRRGSTARDPFAAPTAGAGRCAAGPADRIDPHRRPVAVLRGVVDRQRLRRRPGAHERGCAPFVLGPIGRARGNGAPLATRARALELAKNGKLQRAARRRDRPALERLLGPGEAVYLPARRRGATTVPAVWVGQRIENAPAVRVGVTAAGRRLATVSVSHPTGRRSSTASRGRPSRSPATSSR